jgi:guanine deaminase
MVAAYHRPENSLQYILTPRFAPTCSMEMMRWTGEFARANQLWIQTHLSENQSEIDWVKELFGYPTYTDVYAAAGLLSQRTLLAHCIHLNETEIKLIQDSGSKIAHCPDSNFYLKSGRLPLEHIRAAAIPYALGSDVGAGTSLNMLYHAKLYNYTQETEPVSPSEAFYRLTLGAAKVLEIDTVTGSIQTGKAADLVFLRLPDPDKPLTEDILPELIFTGHEWEIAQVYLNGVRKV